MTATNIAANLVATAVAEAYEQLRIADDVNFKDSESIASSQGGLAAALRRVLWALDEAEDTRDRAADVPNEVAVEDVVAADDEALSRFQWPVAA